MKLVVGLGNPGEKYQRTRHNLGFLVLDRLVEKIPVKLNLEAKFRVEVGETDKAKLIKPQTFMNNSGQAVRAVKDFYKIESQDIWVIHDDVDLEFGRVRVQLGGSSAGHKGVQSVIDHLGEDFWRIRVGVGKSEHLATEDWVLMPFEEADTERLDHIVDQTADLVLEYLSSEIKDETLNFHNY